VDLLTSQPRTYSDNDPVVFDDSALTSAVTLPADVVPGGIIFSNSTLNYSLTGAGKIGGKYGLVKNGAGSLSLVTSNNDFSGSTLINDGALVVAAVANALSSNSPVIIANGTLDLQTNNQSAGAVTLTNGAIAGAGATLTAPSFNLFNGTVSAALTGKGSLTKSGAGSVSLLGLNCYSNRTVLNGGTLVVTNLANGGSPSSLGASSANPTNLVLSGGTLSYQGPAVITDRGYTLAGTSTLDVQGDLTFKGTVAASGGNFTKTGPATLTYRGVGTNLLSIGGGYPAYALVSGSVVLDGSAGSQTNFVGNQIYVGYGGVGPASLILSNTSLGAGSWFSMDRGNGTSGFLTEVSLYNSVLTCGGGSSGLNMGNDTGTPISSVGVLNLRGTSRLVDANDFSVSGSAGSDDRVYITNSATVSIAGTLYIGNGAGTDTTPASTGTVSIASSGVLTCAGVGNAAVGVYGQGVLALQDNGRAAVGGLYVPSQSGGQGTIYVNDNAQLSFTNLYLSRYANSTGTVYQTGGTVTRYTGSAAGDCRIGGNTSGAANQLGIYNLSGGVFNVLNSGDLQIGPYGEGHFNQSGGAVTVSSGWAYVGVYSGGTGYLDVSGGSFNVTDTSAAAKGLVIGHSGTGTLNVSGTGLVNVVNSVAIGNVSGASGGSGTINLNGGVLSAKRIYLANAGAYGILNFNGGTLQAAANANSSFLTGLSSAYVLSGGAVFDSGLNTITVAQPLMDGGSGGGLVKLGAGTLVLSGANSYTGTTRVNAGTLLVNGVVAGAVQVQSGTLGGSGLIQGAVTVSSDGVLSPGDSMGVLNLQSTLSLNGTTLMELDKSANTNDSVNVASTLNYGGMLVLSNRAGVLVPGDTFQLFTAGSYHGAFGAVTSYSPNQAVRWDTSRLGVDGTVKVAGTVSLTPTSLTTAFSNNRLEFSWPADHTGWELQAQTNSAAVGLSTNWVTVSGSSATNRISFSLNQTNGAVFFRLVYP
jgi:fibronectin-binding autotransporter adhesin